MSSRLAKASLALVFLFNTSIVYSQEYFLNLDHPIADTIVYSASNPFHSSIRPFLLSEVRKADSAYSDESIKSVSKKGFIIPALNLNTGYSNEPHSPYQLEAGFHAGYSILKNLTITGGVIAGQSYFPEYLDSFIQKYRVIPGLGRAYGTGPYRYVSGDYALTLKPSKFFALTAGYGKNFFGDGYRSMFLSDRASPYPFFRVNTNVYKFKYVLLLASLADINQYSFLKNDFHRKYSAMHYLSWNISKRINLGFFESIIWQSRDTTGNPGLEVNYLNPVIFYRPVEYSAGSSDNALLGGSFKITLWKHHYIYSQLLLDEFLLKEIKNRTGWWANKYSFQLGAALVQPFRIKGLSLKAELNYIRPFTYSHGSPVQNYGQFNQPLAHPFGANFMEVVGKVHYTFNRSGISGIFIYAYRGMDQGEYNYGQEIYKAYTTRSKEYGNYTSQGLLMNYRFANLTYHYLLLPAINLRIEASVLLRQEAYPATTRNTGLLTLGIRSGFYPIHRDL